MQFIDQIMRMTPVIPIISIYNIDDAVPVARALVAGGIHVLEVTLRTKHGLSAIQAITDQVPSAIVGAGTLKTSSELIAARAAGAVFGASPGVTNELMQSALLNKFPFLPGVMTPSEVISAYTAGFRRLKFFPAILAGGTDMLNALSGPFPDLIFCATGGVSQSNAPQFLACKNVVCVGSSWLAPSNVILAHDWKKITALAIAARQLDYKL